MNDAQLLDLLRLRLLASGPRKRASLARSLAQYGEAPGPRWRDRVDAALDTLVARGELDGATLTLSATGRAAALSALGLTELAPTRWPALIRRHLVPRALGTTAPRVASADGLRAALIAKKTGEPQGTLREVLDRLVWRALGEKPDGPITLEKLRARALARAMGSDRVLPLASAVRVAAAGAIGARRTETRALLEGTLDAWLRGDSSPPDTSVEDFAAAVLRVARDPSTRRFTEDKAFIGAVREGLAPDPRAADRAGFEARLLEAHRRGLVVLSRADLTQLIDPRELAASELGAGGAVYHFVRTDLPKEPA